jgi:hypothetical protein
MSREPRPGHGQDGEEPAGSASPPAAEGVPEDDWDAKAALDAFVAAVDAGEYEVPPDRADGAEQGLFVCLPTGERCLPGFAQHGQADTMPPGPLLAALVDFAAGQDGADLAELSEDELVGVVSAARRLESRIAWTSMAAMREFAARRRTGRDRVTYGRTQLSASVADQLAFEFRLSWQSVAGQIDYACQVAARLPKTFAALAAGLIHPIHVRIIEDETRPLSAKDAARADEKLAEAAQSKSFGQLRYAAHRLVLKLDPGAAQRRKEEAKRDAHVRRFREDSGNAGMVARELPPDEVLASWQHVEQRALDLRAAGMPGSLQELRVTAYLDLLQERDSRSRSAPQEGNGDGLSPVGRSDGSGTAGPDPGPSVAALITVTVPSATLDGRSAAPGEVGGFGLLDADDARDLVAAAARHPWTRWCLTVLNPDGTAAAHGCAPGRHPGPPNLSRFALTPVIRGPCDHAQAEPRYQPSRKLAHLVTARTARCAAPGCGRPAARCDLDHTTPWHLGGLTCQCGLAPLCRHHHRCKQAEGWRLEQPEPGILVWHTPAGRSYATTPTVYSL